MCPPRNRAGTKGLCRAGDARARAESGSSDRGGSATLVPVAGGILALGECRTLQLGEIAHRPDLDDAESGRGVPCGQLDRLVEIARVQQEERSERLRGPGV